MPAENSTTLPPTCRRSYSTDVSDRQWRLIQPLLPTAEQSSGRPRETDLREVLSAVNYRWRTGCPWRMLPHDFPPWGTVYSYYRAWEQAGIIDSIRERLMSSR